MQISEISGNSHPSSVNGTPSTLRKLGKSCNLWINETFQLNYNGTSDEDGEIFVTHIASLFVPIVKYLRLIGFCPFTIKQLEPGFLVFEFRWKSLLTVYSLCVSTTFGVFALCMFLKFLWLCFSQNFEEVLKFQGYKLNKTDLVLENFSRVSEMGTRFVPATFPLFSTISVFGTLASLPNFQIVLNRWSIFQREYLQTFFRRKDDPFITLRQYRNGTFTIFPIMGTVAIAVVYTVVENFWGGTSRIFPQDGLPRFTATFTMLIMIGGHGSHFLMFRTLTEAFKQIHVGIGMWKRDADHRSEPYDYYLQAVQENTKKWTNIVILAKKQVETTSKAVAPHHVSTIFINFIYLCLGVFSCLSSRIGPTEGNRGYILLLFCSWGFSLLTVKAFMCEKIVEQEKLIVDALRNLDVNDNIPALIQINTLIDLIIREPATIRFWNVLTLNKSFLVQLVGQVATYLIVLFQFDTVSMKSY